MAAMIAISIAIEVMKDEKDKHETKGNAIISLRGFLDSGITDLYSSIAYFIGIRCDE